MSRLKPLCSKDDITQMLGDIKKTPAIAVYFFVYIELAVRALPGGQ